MTDARYSPCLFFSSLPFTGKYNSTSEVGWGQSSGEAPSSSWAAVRDFHILSCAVLSRFIVQPMQVWPEPSEAAVRYTWQRL